MLKHPVTIYTFSIKSYHTDQEGNLTFSSLFHFLQECAWDNARLNDFGYEFLKQNNAFWVLSRVLVEIDKYPKWKDEIEIKTWPKGADGFFALRDFEISLKGKVVGRVTSSWLILDVKTRRPRKLDNFNFIHENFHSENAIDKKLSKVVSKGVLKELETRKVYYSDLDVNKHVNNATYVRWIMDSYFSKEQKKMVSEFEINFLTELMLSDEFTVSEVHEDNNSYFVLKNIQNKEVCKARLK